MPEYDVYVVKYIEPNFNTTFIGGFYPTLEEAMDYIFSIIHNAKPFYQNCISGGGYIGWIDGFNYGEFDHNTNPCNQPQNSICIFERKY